MIRTGKFTRLNKEVFAAPQLAKTATKSAIKKLNLSKLVISCRLTPNPPKRYGRLVAQIAIKTPKELNEEQISLLRKLQESFGVQSGEAMHEEDEGIFDKIKGWFKGEEEGDKKSKKKGKKA